MQYQGHPILYENRPHQAKRYCDALAKSGVPIMVGGQKLMQSTYISSDSESISLILCHALIVSLYIYTSSKGPQDKWIYGTHIH